MNDAPEKSAQLKDPAAFAQDFLKLTLTQGFQSLSKKDIELLIFFLMERDGAIPHSASNYEVSTQLRLPINRVKALRRDSYQRWRPLLTETRHQTIQRICKILFTTENMKSGAIYATERRREDGFIAVRIEHPADLIEFEQAIIDVGDIPIYERNREVLIIQFETIFKIAKEFDFIKNTPAELRDEIKKIVGKDKNLEQYLTKPMEEFTWVDLREFVNKAGSRFVANSLNVRSFIKIALPFL